MTEVIITYGEATEMRPLPRVGEAPSHLPLVPLLAAFPRTRHRVGQKERHTNLFPANNYPECDNLLRLSVLEID